MPVAIAVRNVSGRRRCSKLRESLSGRTAITLRSRGAHGSSTRPLWRSAGAHERRIPIEAVVRLALVICRPYFFSLAKPVDSRVPPPTRKSFHRRGQMIRMPGDASGWKRLPSDGLIATQWSSLACSSDKPCAQWIQRLTGVALRLWSDRNDPSNLPSPDRPTRAAAPSGVDTVVRQVTPAPDPAFAAIHVMH